MTRTAVITGAAGGMGKAISRSLAEAGHRLVLVDVNDEGLHAVTDEISANGVSCLPLVLDITVPELVEALPVTILGHYPSIDILVNVAGFDIIEPFLESKVETWHKVISLNLTAHFLVVRALAPHMVKNGWGRIITISSEAARVGSSGSAPYSAAKAGLLGLTKTWARELARYGVCVNAITPGPTDTPLFGGVVAENEKLAAAMVKSIPLRRLAVPEDIAAAVAWLASDGASYVTGQTIGVNGGLVMQ